VVRLKLNYTNVMVIDINQLCCCVVYENLLPKAFVATPVTHNCVVMVVVIMVMVNYLRRARVCMAHKIISEKELAHSFSHRGFLFVVSGRALKNAIFVLHDMTGVCGDSLHCKECLQKQRLARRHRHIWVSQHCTMSGRLAAAAQLLSWLLTLPNFHFCLFSN